MTADGFILKPIKNPIPLPTNKPANPKYK